jgi:xanthine/CO dehydrogenase XdhC/CoxF family maturation factor
MNKQVLEKVCALQKAGQKGALVTIIRTWGSTPRKAGSKMVVQPDGTMTGSIGGGCAEAAVRLQALSAMDEGHSFVYKVDMLQSVAADEGMVCGGVMDVFIQMI